MTSLKLCWRNSAKLVLAERVIDKVCRKVWSSFIVNYEQEKLPLFIEYNAYTSTVRNWNSQWVKKLFLFFKNIFTRINPCKFIHHKNNLKPFLRYLPCIVHKEYFSTIFNVKMCSLFSIKYGIEKYLYLKAIQAKSLPAL